VRRLAALRESALASAKGRLVAALVLTTLAFVMGPASKEFPGGSTGATVLRVLFCGTVAGLLVLQGFSPRRCGLLALAGGALATVALAFALPVRTIIPTVVGVLLAAVVGYLVALVVPKVGRATVVTAMLACMCVGFLWQVGVLPGYFATATAQQRAQRALVPVDEHYHFDGQIFIKTVDLVKQGMPFYPAFGQAVARDSRMSGSPIGKLNYREPWLSEFWALLPGSGAQGIWWSYVVFAMAVMIASYLLAARFVDPAAALLAPIALFAYLAYPALTWYFPFAELWGGGLAVVAVWLLVTDRWWPAVLALVAAVACRELMIYLIPVFGVAWLTHPARRRRTAAFAAAVALPAGVLAYHLIGAPGGSGSFSLASLSYWFHAGIGALWRTLRFSGNFLPPKALIPVAAPVLAAAGALGVSSRWRRWTVLAAAVIPTAALGLVSNGIYGSYWGAISQPLVLALMPVVAVFFFPSTAERGAGASASEKHAATSEVATA
jgi:hypothetical protein